MASRNGLNPKIKAPKGLGYGRALPSAFGFGSGMTANTRDANGNSTPNGYLSVPSLVGTPIPNKWTIEFWVNPIAPPTGFEGVIQFRDNLQGGDGTQEARLQAQPAGNTFYQFISNCGGFQGAASAQVIIGQKNHIVITMDLSLQSAPIEITVNGSVSGKFISALNVDNPPYAGIFELFNLFALTSYGIYTTQPMDEFRMYNKILPDIEIVTNYNNGLGNNPTTTENLFLWYVFEKFETLDFSTAQDESDMKLGIRDMSGMFNHGVNINLITDPTNVNYCLRNF